MVTVMYYNKSTS